MYVGTILKSKGNSVIWVDPDAPVSDAVARMNQEAVGALMVSTDGRKLDGVLSERTLLRQVAEHAETLGKLKVSDVMDRSGPTCTPDTNLKQAMQLMTTRRVHHLPVMDSECLCGVVSIGDVVRYLLDEMNLETSVLRDLCAAAGLRMTG